MIFHYCMTLLLNKKGSHVGGEDDEMSCKHSVDRALSLIIWVWNHAPPCRIQRILSKWPFLIWPINILHCGWADGLWSSCAGGKTDTLNLVPIWQACKLIVNVYGQINVPSRCFMSIDTEIEVCKVVESRGSEKANNVEKMTVLIHITIQFYNILHVIEYLVTVPLRRFIHGKIMLCDHEYQPIKYSVELWILDMVMTEYFVSASRTSCIKQFFMSLWPVIFVCFLFTVYLVQLISSPYVHDAWADKLIRSQNTLVKHCKLEVYDWWQEEIWSGDFI